MCEEKTKKCSRCGREFPANNTYFISRKGVKSGLQARCKECMGSSFKFPIQVKKGYRICPKCNRELPATKEYFYHNKNTKDGLMTDCKECRGHRFTIRIINIDVWTEDGMKPCSKCGRVLPANSKFYYKNSQQSDGLFSKCKECMGGKMGRNFHGKKSYNENGEKKCSSCGNWYPPTNEYFNNKTARADGLDCQCKKCVKAYNESIKDHTKEKNHIRYLNNKDHIRKISDEWKKKNPDKVKEINRRSAKKNKANKCVLQQKRDAKKASLPATFTVEQWEVCKSYFNNRCAYCGSEDKKLTQDHVIPLSKNGEYTINNIVPCCLSCNSKKSNKDLLEWYASELPFYSETRKKKILKYLKTDGEKQQMALEF